MTYTVYWKKLPGKIQISSESYPSLDEALDSANIVMMGGPGSVEITVADSNGTIHFTRVLNNV